VGGNELSGNGDSWKLKGERDYEKKKHHSLVSLKGRESEQRKITERAKMEEGGGKKKVLRAKSNYGLLVHWRGGKMGEKRKQKGVAELWVKRKRSGGLVRKKRPKRRQEDEEKFSWLRVWDNYA